MPPPQDDVAFRSQEYARQVNQDVEPARQRMQGATEFAVQSFGQGMQMRQRQALAERELNQRQQELNLRKGMHGGDLALQQLRIKQAQEELAWANAIHDTKGREAQREMMQAQAKEAKLRVAKLERDMDAEGVIPFDRLTVEEKLGAEASGLVIGRAPRGWKVIGERTPAERKVAYDVYLAFKKQEAEMAAGPKIALEQMRGQTAEKVAELRGMFSQAIANTQAAAKLSQQEQEAIVKRMEDQTKRYIAQLLADAGQKRVETQGQTARDVATTGAESREKVAEGQLEQRQVQALIKLFQIQLDKVQFDTSPEGVTRAKWLQSAIDDLQSQLGGTAPPGGAGPDESADAVLMRGILNTLNQPKK